MKIHRFGFLTLLVLTAFVLAACGQKTTPNEDSLAAQVAPSLKVILDPAALTMGSGEVQDVLIDAFVVNCFPSPIDPDDTDGDLCDGVPEFSVLQAPPGVTASIVGAVLHLEVGENAQSGLVRVHAKITNKNGNQVQTLGGRASLQLTVLPFSLSVTPTTLSIIPGHSSPVTININRLVNFTGAVDLSLSGNMTGLTTSFNPNPASGNSSTLSIDVNSTASAGLRSLTVKGVSGGVTKTATLKLNVLPAPTFNVSVSPNPITVRPGTTVRLGVFVERISGFDGTVNLSLETPTQNMVGFFLRQALTVNDTGGSTLTLKVSPATAPGTYTLLVRGESNGISKVVPVTVKVQGFLPPF